MCGKSLQSGQQTRYIVQVELFEALDTDSLTEDDLDADHLDEMSEYLEELEEQFSDPAEIPPAHQKMRFDLCPGCQKRFVRDPFSRESTPKLKFSKN